MSAREVVVIGGGLAGITAAIALREAGVGVTLLESRPWLGGAASSYRRGDLTIDNGQHVFLRCCQAYRELLARLGVTGSVKIQDRFDVTVLSAGLPPARLRRTALPSPLHLAGALATYPLLTLSERVSVARAALAFRGADPARPDLDGVALGAWLAARGQGTAARRRLWDLFIVSALNIAGDDASVPLAATVIKTALLGERDAADIGMATVPLRSVHGDPAERLLSRLGASVRLGARATAIERLPGGGFRIRLRNEPPARPGTDGPGDGGLSDGGLSDGGLSDGGPVDGGPVDRGPIDGDRAAADGDSATGEDRLVTADAIVLAVPAGQAARLGQAAGLPQAPRWDALGSSPIVNVHVVYQQRVTRLPFAAAVDSPVQWVFDKTMQAGQPAGQYLAVSVSAADDYVRRPAAALRQEFLPALEQLFPAAARTEVTDFFVTREPRATFRQGPGSAALRPPAGTSVPGLVLAGAWTDTGWPDTMEGAVRSGHNAAKQLMQELALLAGAHREEALDAAGTGAA